jgi:hypothetical protein
MHKVAAPTGVRACVLHSALKDNESASDESSEPRAAKGFLGERSGDFG